MDWLIFGSVFVLVMWCTRICYMIDHPRNGPPSLLLMVGGTLGFFALMTVLGVFYEAFFYGLGHLIAAVLYG